MICFFFSHFILFFVFLFGIRHCDTHFIALYDGSVPNDKKLATVCGSNKQELVFQGPNLLVEFNAGYQVPPFDYNGFAANVEFIEGQATTVAPSQTAAPTRNHGNNHHRHSAAAAAAAAAVPPPPALTDVEWTPAPPKFSPCDKIIIEANGRSGHFDTRGRPFAPNCRLIFKGKPTDVVHISLFNYRLRAQSCRSVIEIIDGALESAGANNQKKSLHKMCSPIIRHARDQDGNFVPPQTFVSTGSQIMIALRRFHGSGSGGGSGANSANYDHNDEFIDGAYMFHDGLFFIYIWPLILHLCLLCISMGANFNSIYVSKHFPFEMLSIEQKSKAERCSHHHYVIPTIMA